MLTRLRKYSIQHRLSSCIRSPQSKQWNVPVLIDSWWVGFLVETGNTHTHTQTRADASFFILLIRNIVWLNVELNGTVSHILIITHEWGKKKNKWIKNHLLQCVMGAWHFSTLVSVLYCKNLHILDENRDAFQDAFDVSCFTNRNHH